MTRRSVVYYKLAGDFQVEQEAYKKARGKIDRVRKQDPDLFEALKVWAAYYFAGATLTRGFDPEKMFEKRGIDFSTVLEKCCKRELMAYIESHPNPVFLAIVNHIMMGDKEPAKLLKPGTPKPEGWKR